MFYHIPLPEINAAWEEGTHIDGEKREASCPPDHDYGFFHDALMRANLHIARIVARHEQDAKKVLLHLKQAADHAEAFIQNREETLHTSLLMRGSDYGTFSTNDEANNPASREVELIGPCGLRKRKKEKTRMSRILGRSM